MSLRSPAVRTSTDYPILTIPFPRYPASVPPTTNNRSHTPLPPPCHAWMPFWVRLRAGLLSVGAGFEMGQRVLLAGSVPPLLGRVGSSPYSSSSSSASIPSLQGSGGISGSDDGRAGASLMTCTSECLFVGFSADDARLSVRYAPPTRTCRGDRCAAATGAAGDAMSTSGELLQLKGTEEKAAVAESYVERDE